MFKELTVLFKTGPGDVLPPWWYRSKEGYGVGVLQQKEGTISIF